VSRPEHVIPPDDINPETFFSEWAPQAVARDPDRRKRIEKLDARIQFRLAGDGGGDFYLDIADGSVRGGSGEVDSPDLTLKTDIDTWRQLNAGTIKAPTAVMKGKLKFEGSMYLALRIHFIIG